MSNPQFYVSGNSALGPGAGHKSVRLTYQVRQYITDDIGIYKRITQHMYWQRQLLSDKNILHIEIEMSLYFSL